MKNKSTCPLCQVEKIKRSGRRHMFVAKTMRDLLGRWSPKVPKEYGNVLWKKMAPCIPLWLEMETHQRMTPSKTLTMR